MLRKLFGELASGRLQRLPFIGWHLVLLLLFVGLLFGITLAMGAVEQLAAADFTQVQALLIARFGPIALTLILLAIVLLAFAQLNITAKRIRDTGVPGWLGLLAIALLTGLLSQFFGNQVASIWQLLVTLGLVLIPTAAFA